MKIVYFARLREALGVDTEEFDFALLAKESATVLDLKTALSERGEQWQQALNDRKVLVAIDQEYGSDDSEISQSSEVAFFPPVTGG
jgi:molybdopterin synthase sulfur carrier subunit